MLCFSDEFCREKVREINKILHVKSIKQMRLQKKIKNATDSEAWDKTRKGKTCRFGFLLTNKKFGGKNGYHTWAEKCKGKWKLDARFFGKLEATHRRNTLYMRGHRIGQKRNG
jgi:hypothetical protein